MVLAGLNRDMDEQGTQGDNGITTTQPWRSSLCSNFSIFFTKSQILQKRFEQAFPTTNATRRVPAQWLALAWRGLPEGLFSKSHESTKVFSFLAYSYKPQHEKFVSGLWVSAFWEISKKTFQKKELVITYWLAAFSSEVKSKVDKIQNKAADLRANLNIDDVPIASRSHSPITLSNLSSVNLVSIYGCSIQSHTQPSATLCEECRSLRFSF